MYENCEKWLSQFPWAQSNIFRLTFLSYQQSKPQRLFIYKKKAAIPYI